MLVTETEWTPKPETSTMRVFIEKPADSWNRLSTKASEKDSSELIVQKSENLMLCLCVYVQGDFLEEVRLNLGIRKGQ